jgi:carbamoyl-phosphate synthase large subunit
MSNKSILIFGTGPLQQSLIERCKLKGLFTVGIDPNPDAECKYFVDAFEVVAGDDFEKTLAVAQKYSISGVITAATDKPLVMMARVAEKLHLPFFSVETALNSTDKLLMKKKFIEAGLPCAKGFLVSNIRELTDLDLTYPVIVKPRDNSGSRGVIYCENLEGVAKAIEEALRYTKKGNVLVEEFIEGQEYSIEGIHYNGEHHVIQFTEKTTTDFPYNVEIAHTQPADISLQQQSEIRVLIAKIGQTLGFENCASHTEIKINSHGIYIIETSPRLGGDFISSTLVPLSTGINMEDILIVISTGVVIKSDCFVHKFFKNSGITYFVLPEGEIKSIDDIEKIGHIEELYSYSFDLNKGDVVNKITSSLNRYGYAIFQTQDRIELFHKIMDAEEIIRQSVKIQTKKIEMEPSKLGLYFEEFVVGEEIQHSLSKTIFESDNNFFSLLTMNHHPLHTNLDYAFKNQHGKILVVGTLVFSLAVGITVPDISGKAIANLGYEDIKHINPVFIGDTIYLRTKILDKRDSKTKTDRGIVYVESIAYNQDGIDVLSFRRNVLIKKQPEL